MKVINAIVNRCGGLYQIGETEMKRKGCVTGWIWLILFFASPAWGEDAIIYDLVGKNIKSAETFDPPEVFDSVDMGLAVSKFISAMLNPKEI